MLLSPHGASSLDMVNIPNKRCDQVVMRDFIFSICRVSGWGFSMGSEFQFHSWRVFVLVCALPAIAAFIGLMFMPESPRFLLEVQHSIYIRPYRGAKAKPQ